MSGLSLHKLLADLGWHDIVNLAELNQDISKYHDQRLTSGFLQLIDIGSVSLSVSESDSLISPQQLLLNAITSQTTDQLLLSLIPEYDQISHLRQAIAHYRFLSKYHWPVLDQSFKPKLGQNHPQVRAIRQILVALGDLPPKSQTKYRTNVFDSVVVSALKKFQQRHGLTVDGKLGPQTYAALAVPPKKRIEQLQANLWRWFRLPKQPADNYLLVNIPGYQLSLMEDGKQVLKMKVIVGNKENPTPQMITEINRVTLNPTWTPTRNIINKELIPEYNQDYLSLKRRNFQLVKGYWRNTQILEIDDPNLNLSQLLRSYRLVQAPGDNNALGNYRFNIPNNHSVYLHDTPVKSLFKQSNRALSHGCIRLEDAGLLARYLLTANDRQATTKIQHALKSGKTTNLTVATPLPVYITYQTAWVNKQGKLRWSADIYQLDNKKINHPQFQTTVSNPVITLSKNNS